MKENDKKLKVFKCRYRLHALVTVRETTDLWLEGLDRLSEGCMLMIFFSFPVLIALTLLYEKEIFSSKTYFHAFY